jgi:hypothetical protein
MSAIALHDRRPAALQAILLSGATAGVLDLTAACVFAWIRSNVRPVLVFHYIASGAMGPSAYQGGAKTAALGIAFHFLIAITAAAVYYFASQKMSLLVTQPTFSGVLYGIFVYLFTNFVVVPLSLVQRRPQPLSSRIIAALIIIFCVGLPIAFITRRFARR